MNDFKLEKGTWKQETEGIITDSLWLFDRRDNSGAHQGDYHGNFIPQVPAQLILRYTRSKRPPEQGGVVLDLFCGMATTLIEAKRLGRNSIGVELSPLVSKEAWSRLQGEPNPHHVSSSIICDDSTAPNIPDRVREQLSALGLPSMVDLVILHPPYWNIIKFNPEHPHCLANAEDIPLFLTRMSQVATNAEELLKPGGWLALIMGDYYRDGKYVQLGFRSSQIVGLTKNLVLKASNIKNVRGNERGKGKTASLWRYRHLKNGLYDFTHEHIFIFRKEAQSDGQLP